MKSGLRYILVSVVIAFAFHGAGAQESLSWDLNLYEQMCSSCLELKARVEGGELVSKTEAENKIALFVEMNRKLKAAEGDMTAIQRQRFRDIGVWFTTGVKPFRPEPIPELVCSLPRTISFQHDPVLRTPLLSTGLPEEMYFAIAEFSAPDLAYGLRFGVTWRRWGGYISFRSNFVTSKADYECLSDGTLSNGSSIWAGGGELSCNMAAAAGVLFSTAEWLNVYAGVGYGWRRLHWQDIEGGWAEVSDWSHRGICAEAGLLFSYRRLALSAGLSTIAFKTASLTIGVGLKF